MTQMDIDECFLVPYPNGANVDGAGQFHYLDKRKSDFSLLIHFTDYECPEEPLKMFVSWLL